MSTWLEEIRRYARSDVSRLLVGNKSDLTDQRVVEVETAQVGLELEYIAN